MFRPVHFEIPVMDPPRAITFYSGLFRWQFERMEGSQPYWLIRTGEGPGIDGALMIHPGVGKLGTVFMVEVPDVDEYSTLAQKEGGLIVLPKMTFPGVGWVAYCVDPEGNTFGMLQREILPTM